MRRGGSEIVLATMNARYIHTAFGLRWIYAAMGDLQSRTEILEFTLRESPEEAARRILARNPRILGLGVYIWNLEPLSEAVAILRNERPDLRIVSGGPEISFDYEAEPLFRQADYLVRGEGEAAFPGLCRQLLAGEMPPEKVISAPPPRLEKLPLPWDFWNEEDLAHRVLYVETSRGCPFRCEFCLSSLTRRVRKFPLPPFFSAMERLLERGARWFRFVDRTFNLEEDRVHQVLTFFRERWRAGMQLHFEIVPDRLSDAMIEAIREFPAGGLHLETGIQSFTAEVQAVISRRQNLARTETVLRRLREETGALIHADLVAGLPLETPESFAESFNRLVALRPHEIQTGILKHLKGAPIQRHYEKHAMRFAEKPPREILETDRMPRAALDEIKRIARFMDLFYNSGNFPESIALIWQSRATPYAAMRDLSTAVVAETGRTYRIPLKTLFVCLHDFLERTAALPPAAISTVLRRDYYRVEGRREALPF
jgi:radical SAM superfamily enzyme YgiQ (UPF0313 family)